MGNCLKFLTCNKKNSKIDNIYKFCLFLKIVYGKNSLDGIYDYKGLDKDYECNDFLFNESFYIIFDLENKLYYFNKKVIKNNSTKNLQYFKCEIKEDKIVVKINQDLDNFIYNNNFWKVCYPYEYYDIKEGCIARIGNIRLFFKSINIYDNLNVETSEASNNHDNINDNSLINSTFRLNSNLNCRICLDPEFIDNRYINTCKCFYTIPIHTKCFFKWMDNHIKNIKNEDYYYYEYKNLKCEICLEKFPFQFKKKDGTTKSIFNLNKFKKSHVIIEVYEENNLNVKGVYILFLVNNIIKVGSSETNNFVFNNTSISQNHAIIEVFQNEIKIKDLNSRFGTNLYMQKEFEIKKLTYMNIQINSFMIDFTFIKNFSKKEVDECLKMITFKINHFDNKREFFESISNSNLCEEDDVKYTQMNTNNGSKREILMTNITDKNKKVSINSTFENLNNNSQIKELKKFNLLNDENNPNTINEFDELDISSENISNKKRSNSFNNDLKTIKEENNFIDSICYSKNLNKLHIKEEN